MYYTVNMSDDDLRRRTVAMLTGRDISDYVVRRLVPYFSYPLRTASDKPILVLKDVDFTEHEEHSMHYYCVGTGKLSQDMMGIQFASDVVWPNQEVHKNGENQFLFAMISDDAMKRYTGCGMFTFTENDIVAWIDVTDNLYVAF